MTFRDVCPYRRTIRYYKPGAFALGKAKAYGIAARRRSQQGTSHNGSCQGLAEVFRHLQVIPRLFVLTAKRFRFLREVFPERPRMATPRNLRPAGGRHDVIATVAKRRAGSGGSNRSTPAVRRMLTKSRDLAEGQGRSQSTRYRPMHCE
jgi:hypothetical protein